MKDNWEGDRSPSLLGKFKMPPITKVQVLLNGVPLVGASVLVGELGGQLKTTDDEGQVALPNIAPGYAGYTEVLVEAPAIYATAKAVITFAETTIVNLGEMETE